MCLLQHWTYIVWRRVQQACLIGDIPQAPNHSHANSVLIIRFLVGFYLWSFIIDWFRLTLPPGLWKRQWIGSSVRKAPKLEPHMDKSLWSLDSKILKKKSLFRHSQSYKWLTSHSDSQTQLIFQRGRMLLVWYLVESPKIGRWSDNPKLPVASKSLPSVWHKTRGIRASVMNLPDVPTHLQTVYSRGCILTIHFKVCSIWFQPFPTISFCNTLKLSRFNRHLQVKKLIQEFWPWWNLGQLFAGA